MDRPASRTPQPCGRAGWLTDEYTQLSRAFRLLADDDRELLSLVAWEQLDTKQVARSRESA
ncbi:hypothetical protein ACIBHX_28110 [Nonomuraea sp. NPDC050536]|uniref:hypothetical protein n=1 Tax=Nonomuraea sp. NPDC050536 TaxID=3364366 RepID=UPI0037CB1AB2